MNSKVVCPWWLGYFLLNPFRKYKQNPNKILSNYINNGYKILEVGCGMGYFSIEMANLVGKSGTVYCIDIQEKMLNGLIKRAKKNNLTNRIKTIMANTESLNIESLNNEIDFILLFAVVHEVKNTRKLFDELYISLKPKGKILFSEPTGHVKVTDFKKSTKIACESGFKIVNNINISGTNTIILVKN